jgi:hypothetical protein
MIQTWLERRRRRLAAELEQRATDDPGEDTPDDHHD